MLEQRREPDAASAGFLSAGTRSKAAPLSALGGEPPEPRCLKRRKQGASSAGRQRSCFAPANLSRTLARPKLEKL